MQDILSVIRSTHSTRGAFDLTRSISREAQGLILEGAQWAPIPTNMPNFEVVVVDAKEQLDAIGRVPADMSQQFLRETMGCSRIPMRNFVKRRLECSPAPSPVHGPIQRHGTPNQTTESSSRF